MKHPLQTFVEKQIERLSVVQQVLFKFKGEFGRNHRAIKADVALRNEWAGVI